jgi:hypothetical protein
VLRARDLRSNPRSAAGGRPDAEAATERLDAVRQAAEAAAALGIGATHAVVDDFDHQFAVPTPDNDAGRRRVGMLADVRQALADDVVRRDFKPFREAAVEGDSQLRRDWPKCDERLQRDRQPVRGDDRRVEPTGDGAELGERKANLPLRLVESFLGLRVVLETAPETTKVE